MEKYNLNQTGPEVQEILDSATPQSELAAETQRAQQAEHELQLSITDEENRAKAAERQNADDIDAIENKIPSGASSENKLATIGDVNDEAETRAGADAALRELIDEISALIPDAASALNQLADKQFVSEEIIEQIGAAIPNFAGQFTTLAQLQDVESPKAGDIGIVRTKDTDGHDVFTFYQYKNGQWNEFYSLSYHPQRKPASTGLVGEAPYNGMGRIELPMNWVEGWPNDTWLYYPYHDIVYLMYYWNGQMYAVYNAGTQEGLGLDDNLVVKPLDYNIADIQDFVGERYLPFTESSGVWTITKPDDSTITSTELNNTNIYKVNDPTHLGINVLTQAMINRPNTIYVIQYDFTLGEDITVPANCMLEFDGGSISGSSTLAGNNTGIKAGLVKIFNSDVTLAGIWNIEEAYPEWFGAKGDGVEDDTESFLALAGSPFSNIKFAEGKEYVCKQSVQFKRDVLIDGNNSSIQFEYVDDGYDGLVFGKDNPVKELTSITSVTGSAKTNTLTASSTSGLNVGDAIFIIDNLDRSWSPDTGRNYKAGDIFTVKDISGTTITLNEYLTQDYDNGSNIKLYKINKIKVNVKNLSVFGQFTEGTEGNTVNPIYIIGGFDCSFENVTLGGSNVFHLGTDYCYNLLLSNIRIEQDSEPIGLNYGIQLGCNKNVLVTNCNISVSRHGLTLGGGHYSGNLIIPCRYIVVSDSVFDSYGIIPCLDSHGNAQFVTVDHCVVKNGISMEASDFMVTNCKIAAHTARQALNLTGIVFPRGLISNNNIEGSAYDVGTYTGCICYDHLDSNRALSSDKIVISNNILKCYDDYKRGGSIVLLGGQGNCIEIDSNSFDVNDDHYLGLKFYGDANLNVIVTNNKNLTIFGRDLQDNACQDLKLDIRNNEITILSWDGIFKKMSFVGNFFNLTSNYTFIIQNSKGNTAAGIIELINNKIFKNVDGNYIVYVENTNLDLCILNNSIVTEIFSHPIFNITANKLLIKCNKVDSNGQYIPENTVNVTTLISDIGPFADRPSYSTYHDVGEQYYDTTNSRIIIWTGTAWVDATGTPV